MLSYGDSLVRPTLHSPRRLEDLNGSSGRLLSGSNPPGITSAPGITLVSSLHYGRSPIPVQGTVLRADNCPSGLYKAHGSNIRHSPSLRYQDPQIARRLVDSSRIQDHLYSSEGQAPASVRGAGTTSESQKVITGPISRHDLSRNADTISSVHCETNRDKSSESPQYNRGVFSRPQAPPAALWRRLLGHLSSLTLLVKGGMLRMRSLQLRLRSKWNFRNDYLRIPWDPLCQEDLLWWSWAIQQRQGVDLSLPVPDLSFYSDASDVGWGSIMGDQQVSGVWTPSQKQMSINLREMMAVQNGLLGFSQFLRGKTIALFCDNVTTVAYLRRSGGTRSKVLFLKAREILLWVESMKITILPQFIQGSLNTRADHLSRPNLVIGSEWTLHQQVVQDLSHQWPVIINMFATSLTARLPVFFAPAWEPKATGVDAFLQPWDNLQAYAFPPIAIIRRVPLKLRASHNCDLTLIAPFWPQREWFPDLLELLSDIPIELPKRQDLLRQPHFHRFHENLQMLRLTAWRLSSDSHDKQASLKQWLANLPSVGEHLLDSTIRLAGESSENGARIPIIGPPSPQFRR